MEQTFELKPEIKDRKNKQKIQIRDDFWDGRIEINFIERSST